MGFIQHGKEVEKLEVIIGGERHGDKGYFVKPTLFGNVPDKSKLAQEEIFGPVLCVMEPWKTIEEVIERANDTKYGLAAYVFTEDYKK
jgi:acyl-CoA reductase-like NAD-dependent aldehyde dehydrogenase